MLKGSQVWLKELLYQKSRKSLNIEEMVSTWLDLDPYSVSLGVWGGVRVPTGDDVEVDSSCQRDLVVAPGG